MVMLTWGFGLDISQSSCCNVSTRDMVDKGEKIDDELLWSFYIGSKQTIFRY